MVAFLKGIQSALGKATDPNKTVYEKPRGFLEVKGILTLHSVWMRKQARVAS